jgi:hypothetical protein
LICCDGQVVSLAYFNCIEIDEKGVFSLASAPAGNIRRSRLRIMVENDPLRAHVNWSSPRRPPHFFSSPGPRVELGGEKFGRGASRRRIPLTAVDQSRHAGPNRDNRGRFLFLPNTNTAYYR